MSLSVFVVGGAWDGSQHDVKLGGEEKARNFADGDLHMIEGQFSHIII